MEDDEDRLRFSSGDELRRAAENRFGRSLSREEWERIDPDNWSGLPHGDYSATDLEELLQLMGKLPVVTDPSTLDRQRAQALAHRQRTAAEAKELVEKERTRLFGAPSPPFENDAAAAADWIEARAGPGKTFILSLSVAVPADLDDIGELLWLRDWLTDTLSNDPPHDPEERHALVMSFLRNERSPLRGIRHDVPLVQYLFPERRGVVIKSARADGGTILGDLRLAASRLAKATEWTPVAAVHHILTGGVMSSTVSAHVQSRWGEESFGGPVVEIKILDPYGVSAEEVAGAYVEARRRVFRLRGSPRKRARVSAKRQRLVALIKETPTLSWRGRWRLWNERYPDQRFVTPDAMRRAHERARRP